MSLLEKLRKTGADGVTAEIISSSSFFNKRDITVTDLPILNLAFTGNVDGGMPSGLTIIAGESKSFKSALSLYCMKAYLDKHKDAVAVFYDTEGGITPDYLKSFKIDTDRVLHIPVDHIEQLKFDMVKKLEEIKKGEKVFFLVDSIGQISSKKEIDDATDEKSVADMTRAKALRSLMRLCTMQFMKKELPAIMINHVYANIGGNVPGVTMGGGGGIVYSANTVWIISKAQEKEGTDLVGWNFTINSVKSRFVREKSKFPLLVLYEKGINKYSGLLDIALDMGFVEKPSMGWYTRPLIEGDRKWRAKDTNCAEFWDPLLTDEHFKDACAQKFQLAASISEEDTVEDLEVEDDN